MISGTNNYDPSENFPKGRTTDIVASQMGIGSGKQYEKEKYIVDNRATLTPEDFADWDEGKLSTNKAFKKIKREKESAKMKSLNEFLPIIKEIAQKRTYVLEFCEKCDIMVSYGEVINRYSSKRMLGEG